MNPLRCEKSGCSLEASFQCKCRERPVLCDSHSKSHYEECEIAVQSLLKSQEKKIAFDKIIADVRGQSNDMILGLHKAIGKIKKDHKQQIQLVEEVKLERQKQQQLIDEVLKDNLSKDDIIKNLQQDKEIKSKVIEDMQKDISSLRQQFQQYVKTNQSEKLVSFLVAFVSSNDTRQRIQSARAYNLPMPEQVSEMRLSTDQKALCVCM